MARIRADYVFGTTTAALGAADTTLSSAELSRLPAVTSPDVAAITLHDASAGTYEIVHVTAHTASATTATILRGQEGSTAAAWDSGTTWLHGITVDDTEEFTASGGGASGGVLASHAYNPATDTVPTLGATEADVDATNLAVTFTAPASGAVLVKISVVAIAVPPAGSGSCQIAFSLRNGGTTVTNTRQRIFQISADDKQLQARVNYVAKVTGLTDGNSYTYKLAAWNSAGGTGYLAYGTASTTSPIGPALFEVHSA